MTDSLHLVWDPRFLEYDFGPSHPFQESSRALSVELFDAVVSDDEAGRLAVGRTRSIELPDRSALERFHTPRYLDFVRRKDADGDRAPLDAGDTPSFPGCYDAAARIVGGSLAGWSALRDGRARAAFNPAGGLHHAQPGRASGFCILSDLGVTIASALEPVGALHRIAYIDIDAHHGDGVMYGFYGDGRLLDIDFHQDGRTLFPGTGFTGEIGTGDGAGRKVNVPLLPGTGDREFWSLFGRLVPTLLTEFRPELVVLQCGVDAHRGDRLGETQLKLSGLSYDRVVRSVVASARSIGNVPVLLTGGGGYSAENVAPTLAAAALRLAGVGGLRERRIPDAWRTKFESQTRRPAPVDWFDGEETGDASHLGRSEGILTELERSHGRTFREYAPPPISG